MTVGAFIVARLSSSRLPRKAMMDILGRPMIELMVERVRAAKELDKVAIATSTDPSDDDLEALARRIGVDCFRGSLESVNARLAGAAEAFGCDVIVELLGDNPLVHSDMIDATVALRREGGYDYAATVTKEFPVGPETRLFPVGVRVQAYSLAAARRYVEFPQAEDKGTTAYIFENPGRFKVGYLEAKGRWEGLNRPRLTFAVNYKRNFDLIRSIFERWYPSDADFPLAKALDFLDEEKQMYLLMQQG